MNAYIDDAIRREKSNLKGIDPDYNPDRGFAFTWEKDFPAFRAPETVVHDLIERGSLVEIFGESNTGKSTFALDIALAVARAGAQWRDRRTTHGTVLWIALESAAGLRRRVAAARKAHGISDRMLFADITVPVRLLDVKDVEDLIHTAKVAEIIGGQPIQMIVVDTVHRALAGGDENDGGDMGTLIRGCDLIRQQTGAAVLLIHHSGKDTTRGARGHSSLRAAVDTEIEITGQANPRQAKVTKQRDLPSGDIFSFNLEPIEVATDPNSGEAITACIVVHGDNVTHQRSAPSGKAQAAILRALRNRQAEAAAPLIWTLEDMRKIGRDLGQHKSTARGAVDGLVCSGFLTPTVGGHRLADGCQ